MSDQESCQNTDREIWRGHDEGNGSFYADSLHITKDGALGINCGGSVHVRSIREWHRLAGGRIDIVPVSEVQVSYDLAREDKDLTVASITRVFENGCKVLAHFHGEDAEAFIDAWNSR